jgi:hypothetical protein
MVPTWDDLAYESTLTPTQINFLKTYKFPFTIVAGIKDDFKDEYPLLEDYDYTTVGFRVAEACLSPETCDTLRYPLFLTSGDSTGGGQCMSVDQAREIFPEQATTWRLLRGTIGDQPASNVIQFI